VCKCISVSVAARIPRQMNAFDLLRQPTDPIVTGVVYRATLTNVPDDVPLKGTPYIGQAVRVGTATAVAEARWKEEVNQAKSTKLEVGFIAALDEFGTSAFTWEVLESKTGPRDIVQKWTDYREVELIAQHGGTLRDMAPDSWIPQTFNLQKGGKGVLGAVSMDAFVAKRWNVLKQKLLEYVEQHSTARVPYNYVAPCGYNLGRMVCSVRSRLMYLAGRPEEAERHALLSSLPGWSWSCHNDSWEGFKECFSKYVTQTGSSWVKKSYITPCGYHLGQQVSNIRTLKTFLRNHPDAEERKAWLETLPGWHWEIDSMRKKEREEMHKAMSSIAIAAHDHKRSMQKKSDDKKRRDLAALRSSGIDVKADELARCRADGSVAMALGMSTSEYDSSETKSAILKKINAKLRSEKRSRLSGMELRKFDKMNSSNDKVWREVWALRDSGVAPSAKKKELPMYRKDGSVAKALKIVAQM